MSHYFSFVGIEYEKNYLENYNYNRAKICLEQQILFDTGTAFRHWTAFLIGISSLKPVWSLINYVP